MLPKNGTELQRQERMITAVATCLQMLPCNRSSSADFNEFCPRSTSLRALRHRWLQPRKPLSSSTSQIRRRPTGHIRLLKRITCRLTIRQFNPRFLTPQQSTRSARPRPPPASHSTAITLRQALALECGTPAVSFAAGTTRPQTTSRLRRSPASAVVCTNPPLTSRPRLTYPIATLPGA